MFSYNPENRVLKVQKIAEPDLELNLVEHQLASHKRYVEETIYKDMEFLRDAMSTQLNVSQVDMDVEVGDRYDGPLRHEIRKQQPSYYPVYARFTIDGVTYPNKMEILRIPAMDADGILNVNGERRVLMMQLAAAERISFAADKSAVSVTLPDRNITINLASAKDITVKYGTSSVPLHKLVRTFNAHDNVCDTPAEVYASAFIKAAFAPDAAKADVTIQRALDDIGIYDTYTNTAYALGTTRNALNEALSLDRAKGRILSRPVGPYAAGYRVDDELLAYTRKNLINELYVEALPDIVGFTLAHSLLLGPIPAGTTNCDRLRELLPEYAAYTHIPKDCDISVLIDSSTTLTQEDILLLHEVGCHSVSCQRTRTAPPIEATFEEEVIGNKTVRLGDVLGINIPEGRSYDEWVYYHNNPNLDPVDDSHLNTHDWMALYSLCAYIRQNPDKNFLLDKDLGLLKKVLAANELFSKSLRAVIPKFLTRYRNSIERSLKSNCLDESKFFGLSREWLSSMWEGGVIASADTINPIATIAQTNHLISNLQSDNIPEKMRLLSMGFYGRICPYETPSSKKLGVTNTKAICARIRDGILVTPYRRLLKDAEGKITGVSPELTYMDAQEEAQYRIGDLLSLKVEGYHYVNNKVMARIPAPNNQVTVESVDAYSLDFVNAYCEQHLSPTAALVPFAGADDAVRVTYATNMLKQSVLVQGSQIPRVFTSMYRNMFNHSNTYVIRAEMDGDVFDIPKGKLQLNYYTPDGDVLAVDIPISETGVTNDAVNYLNFHVKPGDRFKKGDILVDSAIAREGIYSPGVNLFAAYLADGYTYEDAVALSDHAASQYISVISKSVNHTVHCRESESVRVEQTYGYRYIPENGVIASVNRQSTLDSRRSSKDVLRSGKQSGILYRIERTSDNKTSREYTARLLSFQRLRVGDKVAGRHSNKGTASVVRKNSAMPCFANGRPVDILLNPCGVPSRMNIGQNFEAYLGFVATLLDVYIESDPFNGATHGDIKLLMRYVWDLANNTDPRSVIRNYPMLPSSLHTQAVARHAAIREWEGCFEPNGTARLWNPQTGKYLENPVTFGVPYILQLEHMVSKKVHSRAGALEEDYSLISKQPTDGSSRGGGQRMGEMEMCAYAAYGAASFLEETCNASSDGVLERVNTTLRQLNKPEYMQRGALVPHSVETFRYRSELLGYKLVDDEGILPECDREASAKRVIPNIRSILARREAPAETSLFDDLRGEFE